MRWRPRWMTTSRDRDLHRELAFHVETLAAAHVRAGTPEPEARRLAHLQFGGVPQIEERVRQQRASRWLSEGWRDMRLAIRLARRMPALTLTIIATLALAIGANSAIFAIVNSVLLKPLPYTNPDRLVMVWSQNTRDGRVQNPLSPADLLDLQRAPTGLTGLEGYFSFVSPQRVAVDGNTEAAFGITVTPGLFALLQRTPLLGRDLGAGGEGMTAVLSHGYWQRRFAGDARIIGRSVVIDGQPATIVGVMPPDFVFPYPGMLGPSGFTRVTTVDLWTSMVFSGPAATAQRTVDANGQIPRGVRWLGAIGRLADGVSREQSQQQLARAAAAIEQQYKNTNQGWTISVNPMKEQAVGTVRPALLALLGGVALLLLMAAANVAHLMLARSLTRQKEQATRVALGAARGRMVRQALTESLMLACAGGAIGLAMTPWLVRALVALAPGDMPRIGEVSADWRVALAAFAMTALTGIIVGAMPAAGASVAAPQAALQEQSRGTTHGASHRRFRGALVVAEVALALVLTSGAGLLLRSFVSLLQVDPGFAADHLLTWQTTVPGRVRTADELRALYRDLFARLEAVPGVTAVGGTTRLPLGSTSVSTTLQIEGRNVAVAELPEVELRRHMHRYFETMNMPIVRGRAFDATDTAAAPAVAVVNETLARRFFPGQEAIGQHLRMGTGQTTPWMTIVGIVGDVRHTGLEQTPAPELYINYLQAPPVNPFIVLRTTGDPAQLTETVRAAVRGVDPELPFYNVETMTSLRSQSVATRRYVLLLAALFGVLALTLAAVGIAGVTAVSAEQRTQEMGIRLALGALPREVIGLVVGRTVGLTTLGIGIGLCLTWLALPLLRSQLFGISASDPFTLAGAPAVLLITAALAAWLPAVRTARLHPWHVLRHE